jgi:hypothetical protein
MRAVLFAVLILTQVASVCAQESSKQELFILSCKATGFFSASVDIRTGQLTTANRKIENVSFDVLVTESNGFVNVVSKEFNFIRFSNNVTRNPERLKKLKFNESRQGVLVESTGIKGTTTFDLSDYGFYMVNDNASLNVSRGTRENGLAGFFTEVLSGDTTTVSFTCGEYSKEQWRSFTQNAYDYFMDVNESR